MPGGEICESRRFVFPAGQNREKIQTYFPHRPIFRGTYKGLELLHIAVEIFRIMRVDSAGTPYVGMAAGKLQCPDTPRC